MILYRPVGTKELELIQKTEYCAFPPRLPEQPIFYPAQFEIHCVGGEYHKELWIPAENLEEFNAHIIGKIEVISEFSDNEP